MFINLTFSKIAGVNEDKMTFEQLQDYMYENHRIRRQMDIAKYFGVTTQAISNWKRTNTIPAKYALKLTVPQPTNNVELIESLTDVLMNLNDSIRDLKAIKSITDLGTHWFVDGKWRIDGEHPIIQYTHLKGNWQEIIGYTNDEILEMDNVGGTLFLMDEREYLNRLQPTGITEASYMGYWTYIHKNGYEFKMKGKTWVDYVSQTFKSAVTLQNK